MNALRHMVLSLMAVAMVLTSGAMALARTAPDGTSIVICTGMGLATIMVDADGREIDPSPICPDCVTPTFADLVVRPQVVQQPSILSVLHPAAAHSARPSVEAVQAAARGPPLVL